MFYIAGIIITFFLAFILLGKKRKTTADWILLAWFFTIGLHLMLVYLFIDKQIYAYPYLLGINILFPLVHGPWLFFYVSALTNQLRTWFFNSLHFLLPVSFLVAFAPFFLLSAEAKIAVYENKGMGYEVLLAVYAVAVKLSGIVYILWSLWLIKKHREHIAVSFSNTDKINLNWLQYLIFGVAVVWLFVLFGNTGHLYSAVVVFVVFMGYWGINQVGIFSLNPANDNNDSTIVFDVPASSNEKTKYLKSGLSSQEAIEIHKRLSDKMQQEQWFTDPELTLFELAKKIEVHPNILSQVINSFEGKNFYDYINSLRIEKFISLAQLPENKKFTILSLCYECGFNSKSSFNKHFKRMTQTTPSAFLNSIENKRPPDSA